MERVDLRGLECPVPTLRAMDAIKAASRDGAEVTVVIDDPDCIAEIPYQARRWAYSAKVDLTADSEWTISLAPLDATGPSQRETTKEEGVA